MNILQKLSKKIDKNKDSEDLFWKILNILKKESYPKYKLLRDSLFYITDYYLFSNKINQIQNIEKFEINLKKFLNKLRKNKKLLYVPNPGNAGDSLITLGTVDFLKKNKIPFDLVNRKYDPRKGDIILYGGGGNLITKYKECKEYLLKNHRKCKIIILPHTINDIRTLKKLSNNVHIICREPRSLSICLSFFRFKKQVFLHKDMAFFLSAKRLKKRARKIMKYFIVLEKMKKVREERSLRAM